MRKLLPGILSGFSRSFATTSTLHQEFGSNETDLTAMFGAEAEATHVVQDAFTKVQNTINHEDAFRNIRFEKLNRSPSKFDILSFSNCYLWKTTAKNARKVHGPMREWADEVKYRTGVHIECEPTNPDKIKLGEYKSADDVEVNVYAFGPDRAVMRCAKLIESMIALDPTYVRLGLFRKVPDSSEVEWLCLRRINSELRPPDVPAISLKLPGKYTLMYEGFKEAALRSAWEETGVAVDSKSVFPSGMLTSDDPDYYWRVPVRYFVSEVPYDVTVTGPIESSTSTYFTSWDARILKQSSDPVDQFWATSANPETGCAWVKSSVLDELQKPLRGANYLTIRYTPPPYSDLQHVTNLPALES